MVDAATTRALLGANTILSDAEKSGYSCGVYLDELRQQMNRLSDTALSRGTAAGRAAQVEKELGAARHSLEELQLECEQARTLQRAGGEDTEKLRGDLEELSARLRRAQRVQEERSAALAGLEARAQSALLWSREQEEAREELERQRDRAQSEASDTRRQLGEARAREAAMLESVERLQADKARLDARVAEGRGAVEALHAQAAASLRRKDALERQAEAARARLAALAGELAAARALAADGAANAASTASAMRHDKELLDRHTRAVERAGARAAALRKELDDTYARNAAGALGVEAAGKERALAVEAEARARRECDKVRKLCALAEAKAGEAEGAAAEERAGVAALEREVEELGARAAGAAREAAAAAQAAGDAGRERDVLAKGLAKQGDRAKAAASALAYQQGALVSLRATIAAHCSSIKALRQGAGEAGGARDAAAAALQRTSDAYFEAQERARLAGLTVGALEARCREGRESLKRAQESLAGVRARRAGMARRLEAAQGGAAGARGEIADCSARLRQVKGEVLAGDTALIRCHFDTQKLEAEVERLASEVSARRASTRQGVAALGAARAEAVALRGVDAAAGEALRSAALAAEGLLGERNLLTGRLDGRLKALAGVREAVAAGRMLLGKGAGAWGGAVAERERLVRELGVLKAKVLVAEAEAGEGLAAEAVAAAAATTGAGSGAGAAAVPAAPPHQRKAQVLGRLQDDLLRAQAEVRLMSDALERPVNLHSWRELQEKRPAVWEALCRLHKGQREALAARDRLGALSGSLEAEGVELARAEGVGRRAAAGGSGEGSAAVLGALGEELKGKRAQLREVEGERVAAAGRVREWEGEVARATEALEALAGAYVKAGRRRGGRRGTGVGGGLEAAAAAAVAAVGGGEDTPRAALSSAAAARSIQAEADRLIGRLGGESKE